MTKGEDNKILPTFPFQAQIFETEAVENNRGHVIRVALEKYNNIFESVLLSYNSVGYKRCPQGQIGASFSRKGSGEMSEYCNFSKDMYQ